MCWELIAIFNFLKIRMRVDIFGTEKCKVTFGLEYIIYAIYIYICTYILFVHTNASFTLLFQNNGCQDQFRRFCVGFGHFNVRSGCCQLTGSSDFTLKSLLPVNW